jgi:hypothetical protein
MLLFDPSYVNVIEIDENTTFFSLQGTVARDFWPLVFFMNRPHMGP